MTCWVGQALIWVAMTSALASQRCLVGTCHHGLTLLLLLGGLCLHQAPIHFLQVFVLRISVNDLVRSANTHDCRMAAKYGGMSHVASDWKSKVKLSFT
jgi:hypothetical protein